MNDLNLYESIIEHDSLICILPHLLFQRDLRTAPRLGYHDILGLKILLNVHCSQLILISVFLVLASLLDVLVEVYDLAQRLFHYV
jgi:hypothetical protein